MGNGMNKIIEGLYLGNFRDARDANQLSENKITHILSIHDNARPIHPDKVYLCLNVSDVPNQNISQYFSECNDFIHKARLDGGSVFVHCMAGVSRSASVVIAYVMTVTNLTYRQAYDAVRGARRCVSPNFGFQRQLLDFQHDRLPQEKIRLRSKYDESSFNDEADCQVLLEIFNKSEEQMAMARSAYNKASSNPSNDNPPEGACASERYVVSKDLQPYTSNACSESGKSSVTDGGKSAIELAVHSHQIRSEKMSEMPFIDGPDETAKNGRESDQYLVNDSRVSSTDKFCKTGDVDKSAYKQSARQSDSAVANLTTSIQGVSVNDVNIEPAVGQIHKDSTTGK